MEKRIKNGTYNALWNSKLHKVNVRTREEYQYTATGYFDEYSTQDGYSINVSSILSKLITEAGRWCEDYASDILFYIDDLKKLFRQKPVTGDGMEDVVIIMGMRQNGVDYGETVTTYFAKHPFDRYYYRALWVLRVERNDNHIVVSLARMSGCELVPEQELS